MNFRSTVRPLFLRGATLTTALLLAACGSGSEPAPVATNSEPAATMAAMPAESPIGDETGAPAAKTNAPAKAAKPMQPISCTAELGKAKAAKLVQQCIRLSPASHPPCNAENSCAMIEGEIARSCAVLGSNLKGEAACGAGPRSGDAAAAAIRRYYSAINAHDLPTAWAVWGPDGNPEQNYDEFAKGYAQTVKTKVTTGTPGRVEGAAGSLYVKVPVTVDAQLANGRRQHFTGSYTLRQVNQGMGVASQGWHITSATLRPS